jgi:SAM-dependent methyltransferase
MSSSSVTFEDQGLTWAQRAKLGEFRAVLAPDGSEKRHRFMHTVHLRGAKCAMALRRPPATLLDFGCGTGRFVRFFGSRGYRVIGTEVTPEMLEEARRIGVPDNASLVVTDGIHLPVPDQSVDLIWVCGVLRLVAQQPVYREVTGEMFRALKPGGSVVNVEVYTQWEPGVFTSGFESVGFKTERLQVLHRYGRFDRLVQSRWIPLPCVRPMSWMYGALRSRFDDPTRAVQGKGIRDYLMVWTKPV